MPENETKVCKGCKHYRDSETEGHPEFAKCAAPQNVKRDRVSGAVEVEITYCSTHRSGSSSITCGAIGRWFEPKEPDNTRAAFESILRMAPIPNRPQREEIEKSIMAGSLDGHDLSDLVAAITAKAKDIAPDFEFDTTSFQDALAAIEDNPKDHEAEGYVDPDDADTGLDLERRSA